MVKTTAKEYTETQAGQLIKTEVAAQVKNRIDAQRQEIAASITQQTKASAESLIRSEVSTTVKSQVDAQKPALEAAVIQQTQIAAKQMVEDLGKNTLKVKGLVVTEPAPGVFSFVKIGCQQSQATKEGVTYCAEGSPPSLFQMTPTGEKRPVASLSSIGFQDNSTGPRPDCTGPRRGTFYVEKGTGTGKIADKALLCVRKSDNTFEWVELAK
jgi:hypothetical protein